MSWLIFGAGMIVGGCLGLIISSLLHANVNEQLWWEGYWHGYQKKWKENGNA